MSDKEEYGLEDICTSLDGIEEQLKFINDVLRHLLKFMEGSKIA